MRPITLEWVDKAEGDFHSALRELRARKHPNYDSACFHSQQCVEKYMKAVLIEAERHFPKIHDLSVLLDMLLEDEPEWVSMRSQAELLNDYAVSFRYPGEASTREEAKDAVRACRLLRSTLRDHFGLVSED